MQIGKVFRLLTGFERFVLCSITMFFVFFNVIVDKIKGLSFRGRGGFRPVMLWFTRLISIDFVRMRDFFFPFFSLSQITESGSSFPSL